MKKKAAPDEDGAHVLRALSQQQAAQVLGDAWWGGKNSGQRRIDHDHTSNHDGSGYVEVRVPLSWVRPNDAAERYDGTVNADRMREYVPQVITTPVHLLFGARAMRRGMIHAGVNDGGHRVSAARLRGDTHINAIMQRSDYDALLHVQKDRIVKNEEGKKPAVAVVGQQIAAAVPAWRVAEFWSSANPGTTVLMLAKGDEELRDWGKRSDFIGWHSPDPHAPQAVVQPEVHDDDDVAAWVQNTHNKDFHDLDHDTKDELRDQFYESLVAVDPKLMHDFAASSWCEVHTGRKWQDLDDVERDFWRGEVGTAAREWSNEVNQEAKKGISALAESAATKLSESEVCKLERLREYGQPVRRTLTGYELDGGEFLCRTADMNFFERLGLVDRDPEKRDGRTGPWLSVNDTGREVLDHIAEKRREKESSSLSAGQSF